MTSRWNYDAIKELARQTDGVNIADLCALAPKNDPFYTGRPAEVQAAQWFADLWHRFGYADGVHLRRVHYRAVSQDPPMMRPDGTVYENTERCWAYLCSAGKWARYLGLVDVGAFVDRRNPDAIINADWSKPGDWSYSDPEPCYKTTNCLDEWDGYELPELPKLRGFSYWLPDLPEFEVGGYDSIQQSYHLEVWCEKTTMNDVLEPLCRRYGANLVTGAGEMSITAVRDFMDRARQAERPARILYVSDYDPAGLGMPISVARKVEFFQRQMGDGDLDMRLQAVILTADQVERYALPRVPVKDTDLRKDNWEAHHGKGQVELDALEALHPGELERIVKGAMLQYYDPTLRERALEVRNELRTALAGEGGEVLGQYRDELGGLESDYGDLRDDFEQVRQEFDELASVFQERIDAYQERVEEIVTRGRDLHQAVLDGLDEVDVDLHSYGLPNPNLEPEGNGTLYASDRDYLDQLEQYKLYREGGQ